MALISQDTPESLQANILTFLTVLALFSLQPQQVVSHNIHFLLLFFYIAHSALTVLSIKPTCYALFPFCILQHTGL